jgi:broad specificity phosphatase PhoE
MKSTSLRLYLIRHGQTAWSLSGRHTGRTDVPLTGHGEEESRALAPMLRDIAFRHVLTSPASRAQRTCVLSGLGKTSEVERDLAEWDYGEYEGLTSPDIRKERPDWNVFHDGCPGGETVTDVTVRADRLIGRLVTLRGDVALFSSRQFGCSLAVRWIGLPVIEAQHLMLGAACISVLGYNPAHPEMRVITAWNQPANGLSGEAV